MSARWRRATMGAGRRRVSRVRSAGRTRFQLTPDSVRGERMRRYAPQGGAAVDAVLESASGGASAAHQCRADVPRRCRGLTERRDRSRGHTLLLLREAVMSLLPDSIRKLCDKCTLFSNRCAGVRQRRRSAAHLHRCVCPRRCRGLTEDETARAVILRLWSSGVFPARRQRGRVESRHAALRSAYRVTAECRRSATMSASAAARPRRICVDACTPDAVGG